MVMGNWEEEREGKLWLECILCEKNKEKNTV